MSGKCVTGMIWQVVGKVGCTVGCRIYVLDTQSSFVLEKVLAEVSFCWRLLFDVDINFKDWLSSPQGELMHILVVSRSIWYGSGISGSPDSAEPTMVSLGSP